MGIHRCLGVNCHGCNYKHFYLQDRIILSVILRYDLTDTAGVLENKVLGMFHGLDDQSVLVEGF